MPAIKYALLPLMSREEMLKVLVDNGYDPAYYAPVKVYNKLVMTIIQEPDKTLFPEDTIFITTDNFATLEDLMEQHNLTTLSEET